MDLEALKKTANYQLTIDQSKLDVESARTSKLHTEWLSYFTDEIVALRLLENKYKSLYKNKWLYFTGKASSEEYEKKPFDLKILRSDVSIFLDGDEELQTLDEQIVLQKAKVKYIEETLKAINGRQWAIRNSIDYLKFINGK